MQSENLIEPRKSSDFLAGIEAARPFSELSSPSLGASEKNTLETSQLGNGLKTYLFQNLQTTFGLSESPTTFFVTLSGMKSYDMENLIRHFFQLMELSGTVKMEISKSSLKMVVSLQENLLKQDEISFKEPPLTLCGSMKSANKTFSTSATSEPLTARVEYFLHSPLSLTSTAESELRGCLTYTKNS